jgi:hypothetical protein
MSVCNSPNSEAAATQTPLLGMRLRGAVFEVPSRFGCVPLLRLCSDCFFGLARTSMAPCFHAICGKSNKRLKEHFREQGNLRAGLEESWVWLRPFPEENRRLCLMLVVSDKTSRWSPKEHTCPPKTKRNGAAPAHARSEVARKRGRGNVVAEVEKLRAEVATRLRVAFEHL